MQRGLHGEESPQFIAGSHHTRADKKLGRVFVDLSGPRVAESLGRKWCILSSCASIFHGIRGCT